MDEQAVKFVFFKEDFDSEEEFFMAMRLQYEALVRAKYMVVSYMSTDDCDKVVSASFIVLSRNSKIMWLNGDSYDDIDDDDLDEDSIEDDIDDKESDA